MDKLILGFTGTSQGMTEQQRQAAVNMVTVLIREKGLFEIHHGDCVGSDEQFHHIARTAGLRVVLHPPEKDRARAWCEAEESRDPLPYLVRNRVIVAESQALLATPLTETEQLRSGTWATIRSGWRAGKPVFIINPNGQLKIFK